MQSGRDKYGGSFVDGSLNPLPVVKGIWEQKCAEQSARRFHLRKTRQNTTEPATCSSSSVCSGDDSFWNGSGDVVSMPAEIDVDPFQHSESSCQHSEGKALNQRFEMQLPTKMTKPTEKSICGDSNAEEGASVRQCPSDPRDKSAAMHTKLEDFGNACYDAGTGNGSTNVHPPLHHHQMLLGLHQFLPLLRQNCDPNRSLPPTSGPPFLPHQPSRRGGRNAGDGKEERGRRDGESLRRSVVLSPEHFPVLLQKIRNANLVTSLGVSAVCAPYVEEVCREEEAMRRHLLKVEQARRRSSEDVGTRSVAGSRLKKRMSMF